MMFLCSSSSAFSPTSGRWPDWHSWRAEQASRAAKPALKARTLDPREHACTLTWRWAFVNGCAVVNATPGAIEPATPPPLVTTKDALMLRYSYAVGRCESGADSKNRSITLPLYLARSMLASSSAPKFCTLTLKLSLLLLRFPLEPCMYDPSSPAHPRPAAHEHRSSRRQASPTTRLSLSAPTWVTGGGLAIWAVVFGIAGLRNHDTLYIAVALAAFLALPFRLADTRTVEIDARTLRFRRFIWSRWFVCPLADVQRVESTFLWHLSIEANGKALAPISLTSLASPVPFVTALEQLLGRDRVSPTLGRIMREARTAAFFNIAWYAMLTLTLIPLQYCFGWTHIQGIPSNAQATDVAIALDGSPLALVSRHSGVTTTELHRWSNNGTTEHSPVPNASAFNARLFTDDSGHPVVIGNARAWRSDGVKWTSFALPQESSETAIVSAGSIWWFRKGESAILPLFETNLATETTRAATYLIPDGILTEPVRIAPLDDGEIAVFAVEMQSKGSERQLAVYVREGEHWKRYPSGPGVESSTSVIDIATAPDGNLWALTHNSASDEFIRFDRRTGTWNRISLAVPSPIRVSARILIDDQSRIWLNNGELSAYVIGADQRARQVANYSDANSNITAANGIARSKDGKIWTGGSGLYWLDGRSSSLPGVLSPEFASAPFSRLVRPFLPLMLGLFGIATLHGWMRRKRRPVHEH